MVTTKQMKIIDGLIEEKEGDKHLNAASTNRNSEVLKKYLEV